MTRISALLVGTAILLFGQGLLQLLIPLSMQADGFSARPVGLVVSAYFTGFAIGAWYGVRVIRRVGHIRAYGGLIAVMIVATLSLPLLPPVPAWIIMRLLHGLAGAGVFLTIESWINAFAPGGYRARIMSVYMAITLGALGLAPLLANLYPVAQAELFALAGLLLAASILPVVLTRIQSPQLEDEHPISPAGSVRHFPSAVAGALAGGLCAGGFWAIVPLFAIDLGLSTFGVTALVAASVLGGMLLQWPIGYLSDTFDRRRIVLWLAVAGLFAAGVIIFSGEFSRPLLFAGLILFAGVIFSLYPLAVAHASDLTESTAHLMSVCRELLLISGVGMALGPMLAGEFHARFGQPGLFIFASIILAALALYEGWRIAAKAPIKQIDKGSYVPMTYATPIGPELNPRIEEEG